MDNDSLKSLKDCVAKMGDEQLSGALCYFNAIVGTSSRKEFPSLFALRGVLLDEGLKRIGRASMRGIVVVPEF